MYGEKRGFAPVSSVRRSCARRNHDRRRCARARGRGAAILKPFSNMTVIVAERVAPVKVAKEDAKKSKPKTQKKEAK